MGNTGLPELEMRFTLGNFDYSTPGVIDNSSGTTPIVKIHEWLPVTGGRLVHNIEIVDTDAAQAYPNIDIVIERINPVCDKICDARMHESTKGLLREILDKYATVRRDNAEMRGVDWKRFPVDQSERWGKSRYIIEMAAKGRIVETDELMNKLLSIPFNKHMVICARRIAYDLQLQTPATLPFKETAQSKALFDKLLKFVEEHFKAYKKRVIEEHAKLSRDHKGQVNMIQL